MCVSLSGGGQVADKHRTTCGQDDFRTTLEGRFFVACKKRNDILHAVPQIQLSPFSPGGYKCQNAAVPWYENPRSYDPFESEFSNMLSIYRAGNQGSVRFRTHVIFSDL